MPLAAIQPRPIDYSLLIDVKPTGPSVGYYSDRPIPSSIVDTFGRRLVFAGIAPRKWNGRYNVDALKPGEFIVEPGLIYRVDRFAA